MNSTIDITDLKDVGEPDAKFIYQHAGNDAGETAVRDYAVAAWNAINGDVLREAEYHLEIARRDEEEAYVRKTDVDEALQATERYESQYPQYSKDGHKLEDTPFLQWGWYNITNVSIITTVLVLLLGLGVANVATTILSSGIPIFLEQPWVAWMLGGLVPAASFTLKYFYHVFRLDRTRYLYAMTIYAVAIVLLFLWVILFAATFDGVTGGVDWESLGSGGGHDWLGQLRTAVQILGEVFCGAALFLVIDRLHSEFSHKHRSVKSQWLEKTEEAEEAQNAHEQKQSVRIKAEGRFVKLLAARTAYVERAVAAWIAQRTATRNN